MTDLLALLLIAGMAVFGQRRGLVGMALLAGGLVGGYLAALVLFRPVGGLLASVTGLPGLVTYPVAGMAVLGLVSAAMNFAARRHRRERTLRVSDGWEPPPSDRYGGMALGATYGLAMALVVSWAGLSLAGLVARRDVEGVRNSLTGRLSTGATQRAVALGARAVVGDRFVAGGVGRMVADPYRAVEGLNGVMADERMQGLLRSGALQEAARSADPRILADNRALVELAGDETFANAMRTFGLVSGGEGGVDPREVAESIVDQAGPALRSVDTLMNDTRVQELLANPRFREPWEQGDFRRLAGAAEFRELVDRILGELRRNN